MAGIQEAIFGDDEDYHFGPGALYINTSTGFIPAGYTGATGTGTYIGKTGPMEISIASTYAEQTSIQTGAGMDDAAVSGQKCEVSTTLKEAGLDRLESSVDGVLVERDTAGAPTRWGYVSVIGKRKRATAFQATFVEIQAGIQQWTVPFKIIDLFETVPMSPDTAITIDAEGFREVAVMFNVFQSETNLDSSGRQAFFLSRELV